MGDDVKRYEITPEMAGYPPGWYVRHEDYAKIRAKCDAAIESLRLVRPYINPDVTGCSGRKCRMPTCEDCCGEELAREESEKAWSAMNALDACIPTPDTGETKESIRGKYRDALPSTEEFMAQKRSEDTPATGSGEGR